MKKKRKKTKRKRKEQGRTKKTKQKKGRTKVLVRFRFDFFLARLKEVKKGIILEAIKNEKIEELSYGIDKE